MPQDLQHSRTRNLTTPRSSLALVDHRHSMIASRGGPHLPSRPTDGNGYGISHKLVEHMGGMQNDRHAKMGTGWGRRAGPPPPLPAAAAAAAARRPPACTTEPQDNLAAMYHQQQDANVLVAGAMAQIGGAPNFLRADGSNYREWAAGMERVAYDFLVL
ncbi:hypothetical protein PCANC_03928 [Puccinia coronata f. sp. avenae]|uniref:Uncharacterized protein n=1 Tax=Puccinia coronata f. sp. avenae TaxID=200324 RepID=A0A2N5SSD7_9BASI|nr:hypothetical protein PCANC_17171 [Puccinia coronata f. sp. avenae]PLW49279.1 hypothetical protein PCASD_02698 [Puccinia coronata f. sp. avenae]PLW56077.1 hypothetical protein PCANC_03928 [Puccinia coronata f. sp. avenae]